MAAIQSAFSGTAGSINVLTTAGDMLYENATPANARLAAGTSGQVLTLAGSPALPTWAAAAPTVAAWQSNLLTTGALAETFPRINAQATIGAFGGNSQIGAIPLPTGMTVTNITVITSNQGSSAVTHGWLALTDSTGKVLAVTADQGASWLSATTTATTTALGSPYTTTTAGIYYIVMGITATTAPSMMGFSSGGVAGAIGRVPILGGNAGVSGAPPAVASTLSFNFTSNSLYAYVS